MARVVTESPATRSPVADASLVDLLDRVLAAGVVLSGDVTISLAGVDLITVQLRAMITSVHNGDKE